VPGAINQPLLKAEAEVWVLRSRRCNKS